MNDKQFLIHLQEFLIHLNLNQTSSDVLNEIDSSEEYFVKHLKSIKYLRATQKAKAKISLQKKVFELMNSIKNKHGNIESYIESLINKPQHSEVIALFRKFESIEKEDTNQMILESELIELLNTLDKEDDKSG